LVRRIVPAIGVREVVVRVARKKYACPDIPAAFVGSAAMTASYSSAARAYSCRAYIVFASLKVASA